MIAINAAVEAQPTITPTASADLDDDSDESGVLDRIATVEEGFPELTETIRDLVTGLHQLSDTVGPVQGAIEAANARPKPLAARLSVMKQLSMKLTPLASNIEGIGRQFVQQLRVVDPGVTELISLANAEDLDENPSAKESICQFFRSITELVDSAGTGLGSVKDLAETIRPLEGLSKDMRKPLRTIRTGLLMAYDGLAIMEQWSELVEHSEIDCGKP